VKSLRQEQASGDYYWFGKSPFFMDELVDTCSQQLKWIIWQSYQRLTLFRYDVMRLIFSRYIYYFKGEMQ
jgi:hypothetical protein